MTEAIRPFTIAIPEAALTDLQTRLANTRWPRALPAEGWERGIPVDYVQDLADYWCTGFDWRKQEAALNAFPQFLTEIDGQTIHFLHVKSPVANALPLLVSHGWPGSVAEFMKIIGPLTDPAAHGGDPADAFHVVAPSLPGFGFSVPLSDAGWNLGRTTAAFSTLMHRLGYDRYGAQGGDIGAGVSGLIGMLDAGNVIGSHINADQGAIAMVGSMFPPPSDLTDDEKQRLAGFHRAWETQDGYAREQATSPQTLAYGLADSPAGQLAWIAEKFEKWTNPAAATPDQAVDRDQLLTNVSIYWFTNTAGTSANIYFENTQAMPTSGGQDTGGDAPAWSHNGPQTPQGWAMFNTDPLAARVLNPGGRMSHFTEYAEGGHFAAMETPDLLVDDIRAFFRPLR